MDIFYKNNDIAKKSWAVLLMLTSMQPSLIYHSNISRQLLWSLSGKTLKKKMVFPARQNFRPYSLTWKEISSENKNITCSYCLVFAFCNLFTQNYIWLFASLRGNRFAGATSQVFVNWRTLLSGDFLSKELTHAIIDFLKLLCTVIQFKCCVHQLFCFWALFHMNAAHSYDSYLILRDRAEMSAKRSQWPFFALKRWTLFCKFWFRPVATLHLAIAKFLNDLDRSPELKWLKRLVTWFGHE